MGGAIPRGTGIPDIPEDSSRDCSSNIVYLTDVLITTRNFINTVFKVSDNHIDLYKQ